MEESKEIRQIPVEEIIPNRFQPRINFDENALNELASSIKQHGIIQPLVLRPLGDKFEIIAGERRYKAANIAGLSVVPAIVTDMDDDTSAEVALVENVQRKDLSSIEEAKSYKNMLDRGNMTQEELAKKMGLSQSTIANKLRLLNLSEEVQTALMQGKISERHARSLLTVGDKEKQVDWLNRIINERLTVRQLDLAIKDEQNEKKSGSIEEDVPIVNINPDIESIINNATDINSNTVEQPKTNVFEGIGEFNPTPVVEEKKVDETPINFEEPKKQDIPNKFFNFLEDQEVNMSMEEQPKVEKNQPESDNIMPGFGFEPEFKTEEVIVNNSQDINNNEEIETLDVEANNNTQPEELVFDFNETSAEPQTEVINKNIQQEQTVITNDKEEFIFDDEESSTEPVSSSVDPASQEVKEEVNNIISNDEVDPIPVVKEDNVIDPVTFFDTLEPDFFDKLKEEAGLDLKTAINKYRDLTNSLNEEGFNISIDETDINNKYHIVIDITKE